MEKIDEEACRKAFEEWDRRHYTDHARQGDGYVYPHVELRWQGFKAAWNTRPREAAPEVVAETYVWMIEKGGPSKPEYLYYDGLFSWTNDVYKALWFIRREDADAVGGESLDDVRICKHCFEKTVTQPQMAGDVVEKVHGVCSNKPRPSTQNNHSKGSQYWRSDVWHIRKSGTQAMCGVDSSEWLDMGMLEVNGETCKRCINAKTALSTLPAAQEVSEKAECWEIPLSSMSGLAQTTFKEMMRIISRGGAVDVVARVDGRDYRWECDGLKYAKLRQHEIITER